MTNTPFLLRFDEAAVFEADFLRNNTPTAQGDDYVLRNAICFGWRNIPSRTFSQRIVTC